MIYPMFTMIVLIYGFMLFTLTVRVRSVKSGLTHIRYFKIFEGDAPDLVIKTNRHFSNLFETPVLFFAAGILCIVLHVETTLTITLAWCFVALRSVHMFIHITYNKVLHRMAVFLLSTVCILILWCAILAKQLSHTV